MKHCERCINYEMCKDDLNSECRICSNNGYCEFFNKELGFCDALSQFPNNKECIWFKDEYDYVKVIRCENCKWYIPRSMHCGNPFGLSSERVLPDQFCNCGEGVNEK